jgi:ribosomal protein S18 acetylase RimI-like enzyme
LNGAHLPPPARPAELIEMDEKSLAALLAAVLPGLVEGSEDPDLNGRPPDIYIANLVCGRLGDFSRRIILSVKDNVEIIGLLIALPDREEQMHIYTLAVLPSHRNKGAAGCLLADFFNRLQGSSWSRVLIDVHPDNTPALRLYAKYGFELKK